MPPQALMEVVTRVFKAVADRVQAQLVDGEEGLLACGRFGSHAWERRPSASKLAMVIPNQAVYPQATGSGNGHRP